MGGMIRHGAQLVFAYGRATVPRVCVILRKSYGGAYIVMDSKRMGNDVCLAWPGAELAVMARVRRRPSSSGAPRRSNGWRSRRTTPSACSTRTWPLSAGYIDAVIEPDETRREITRRLRLLASKREQLRPRKHDNSPL